MVLSQLAVVLRRRWYLTLVLSVLAFGVALSPLLRPPVYASQVTAIVLLDSGSAPNLLTERSPAAIAAVAVMDVNRAPLTLKSSRTEGTLIGLGITRGTLIQLQNSGVQWAPAANESYIEIEATDITPEAVREKITAAVRALDAAIARRQDELGGPQPSQIHVELSPPEPIVVLVPPSSSRVIGAGALAAIAATVVGVVLIDRRLSVRNRRIAGESAKRDAVDVM